MRDEEVGKIELLLEVVQEVEDLGAHRDVERRDCFVEYDQARIHHQGSGDADPLALAAGERMWVPPHVFGAQADHVERFGDPEILLLA